MNRRFFLSLLPAAVAAPAIARVLPAPRPAVDGYVIHAQILQRYMRPALIEFANQIDRDLLYFSERQDPERWT